MKLLCVIGYPISHSISPAIYNAAFPAMGLDAHYEAWATPPPELPRAIERLRGPEMLGMNVTVPHKQAVMPLLDEVDPAARAIGAVNCISQQDGRLTGYNTDKYGFLRSLREARCEPAGLKVVVLGAGGAARAVGFGLVEAGAAEVALAGRTSTHVSELAAHLRAQSSAVKVRELGWQDAAFDQACLAADLIVNCTPLGMKGTPAEAESPLRAELLRPGVWVCDLVYNPLETPLLRLAREAESRPIGGLEMLILQAAESVRLWTGQEAPVDIMRSAAHKALGIEA